jgi:hypothetical protein
MTVPRLSKLVPPRPRSCATYNGTDNWSFSRAIVALSDRYRANESPSCLLAVCSYATVLPTTPRHNPASKPTKSRTNRHRLTLDEPNRHQGCGLLIHRFRVRALGALPLQHSNDLRVHAFTRSSTRSLMLLVARCLLAGLMRGLINVASTSKPSSVAHPVMLRLDCLLTSATMSPAGVGWEWKAAVIRP